MPVSTDFTAAALAAGFPPPGQNAKCIPVRGLPSAVLSDVAELS